MQSFQLFHLTLFDSPIRPKGEVSQVHVGVAGQNFDPVDFLDPEFVDFFHENIYQDLVFRKLTQLTYWKPKMKVGLLSNAALVHKGLASPSLLSTYEIERLPVVTLTLSMTSNLYTHAFAKSIDEVKGKTKDGASGPGFLNWRDTSLYQLEINYRWSPVVYDVRGANGLDTDALKTADCHKDAKVLKEFPGAKAYRDTEGHAYKAYHIADDGLTPDWYVGLS
ncbi:hypothetical protein C8Q74DRAFT_1370903 [Fomes fomentarius]|nr:hypothetical protein C8Q74DRAFT_1370903 [Fomes fomentarius]